MWKTLLAVALGGACGSVARWAITRGLLQLWGPAFPWGTWAVNVMGGVLIGGLSIHLTQGRLSPTAQALLMTGFLGGLTTFSSFSLETMALIQQQRLPIALLNVVLNLAGAFMGVGLGQMFTQRLYS
jgi:CrcB protein